jgi:hypothetical protein
VQPDIGVTEQNGDIVDTDLGDSWEIGRLQADPLNEVFLSDPEVVRETRIQYSRKTRRGGHELPLFPLRQAHPDHDLLRLDGHLSVPNHDDSPLLKIGKFP